MSHKFSREEVNLLRNYYFKLEGENILRQFADALNNAGITFWLEFGTLLGYYRDKDFIPHDCDLDFGAFLSDAPALRKALEAAGFKLLRVYTDNGGGREECYRMDHTTLDVFYFCRNEKEGTLYCTSYSRAKRHVLTTLINRRPCTVKEISIPDSGFSAVDYKGCRVNVPSDCQAHLALHYGPTFMTPDPNFDYKKVAKNIRYFSLDERKGIARFFGHKYPIN